MSLTPPGRGSQFDDDAYVRALERMAQYGTYLRQQGQRLRNRQIINVGHGILKIIREELGEEEIKE